MKARKVDEWRLVLVGMLMVVSALVAGQSAAATIKGSKHDLSPGGEGPVTSTSEQQVCVFCHVPHRSTGDQRLFNRRPSVETYIPYQSSTLVSVPAQPGGVSTLCLSCHDGTIALGELGTGTRQVANTAPGGYLPPGRTLLGVDLSDDHPVSVVCPAGRAGIHLPAALDRARLDKDGQVQCTSCHSPHDPSYEPFLVKNPFDSTGTRGGGLCLSCHAPTGWASGAHAGALQAAVPAALGLRAPYATVAQAACLACHRVHTADERPRLARETGGSTCLGCHDGTTAPDLSRAANMPFGHPPNSGGHDPAEQLRARPLSERHAACADCHNPHAALASLPSAGPGVPGSVKGALGVVPQYGGSPWSEPTIVLTREAAAEYQVCFKCHSQYSWGLTPPTSPSRRQTDGLSAPTQASPARAFNPQNGGLHAVVGAHPRSGMGAAGTFRGIDRAGEPWGWDSVLLCTDCHGSDQGEVSGPHGSNQPFILKAPWVHRGMDSAAAGVPETGMPGTDNHLCFRCHDSAAYLNGMGFGTGFRTPGGNNLHGGGHHQVACVSCHSAVPHGYKNRAMLVERTDPYPYNAGAKTSFNHDTLGRPVLPPSGNWQKADCLTTCHTL